MNPIKSLNDNKGKPDVPYYQDKAKMDKVTQESDAFKKKWKRYSRGSGVPGKYGMPATLSFKEFKKADLMEEPKLKSNEFIYVFSKFCVAAKSIEEANKVAALYGTDKATIHPTQGCAGVPLLVRTKVIKPIVTAL